MLLTPDFCFLFSSFSISQQFYSNSVTRSGHPEAKCLMQSAQESKTLLMNRKIHLLAATFGIMMFTLSARAASIPISTLPFTITAPGTYVLTGNLTSSSLGNAISVGMGIQGPIIVDLKGFTITGPGESSIGVSIGLNVPGSATETNPFPITVRNGTISNFGFGVLAEHKNPPSDITVQKIVFNTSANSTNNGAGVFFYLVHSSTISSCTFNGGAYGIQDSSSSGGNRYNNDTFVGTGICLSVSAWNIVLNHSQFDGPPAD
jgi:hypothetical protein